MTQSNPVIRMAAEKAADFARALRTYDRRKSGEALARADIVSQSETILTILRNKTTNGVGGVLRFVTADEVPCYPGRLSQAWLNRIYDAHQSVQYTGRLELGVESVGEGRSAAGSVMDDGPGIPDDFKERVFDPFFTTKEAGEGAGLGLDIRRRILSEIGATIEYDSHPKRTRFAAILPTGHGEKRE